MRRNGQKSRCAPTALKKPRFAEDIGEHYAEIVYTAG